MHQDLFREIDAGLAAGASDWQFKAGEPCVIRVHGALRRLEGPVSDEARLHALAMAALASPTRPSPGCDAGFERGGEYYRLHAYTSGGAYCLALRHIPGRIRGLASLGVPPAFADSALQAARGLILVTGSTGSGKSTTLAAALDHLNARSESLILTLEDPIEFRHAHRKGLVRQLQKGIDFETYAEAIRGALRSDPDVMLIGEMRDGETIAAALTAAETGLLVLGTLHCGSARDAISRIIDAHSPERAPEVRLQLAKSLVAVLAQQLVRSRDRRRVAAFELLLATAGVRHLIEDPAGNHGLLANEISTGGAQGMISMDQSLIDLWRRRQIDRAEALRASANPEAIERQLR